VRSFVDVTYQRGSEDCHCRISEYARTDSGNRNKNKAIEFEQANSGYRRTTRLSLICAVMSSKEERMTQSVSISRQALPEILLATGFLVCGVVAVASHRILGFPLYMLGEVSQPESTWDLFWLRGSIWPQNREWWYGLGYSWSSSFSLVVFAYVVARVLMFVRKLITKA